MATKTYRIINGDSAQELKHIPDNSIDAVITDPPYGIEFLGKDWDSNTGAVAIWAECHRILKPGGHLLAFSAARTYHHLATNIESVGFEIRDQLMWIYSSGFPKAQDMGKAIQRRMGVKETREIPKEQQTSTAGFANNGAQEKTAWSGQQTVCTDPEAQKWEGWKTALKPGHEPIVMARKRFRGSNNHPTVKPVALMRYLIQLVTPANSHVIDPFTGSGTTGMAAVELGHRFTGIEQDPHYAEIANKRIAGWLNKDTDSTAKENTAKENTQYDRLFE
jgi:DNA modification methylase